MSDLTDDIKKINSRRNNEVPPLPEFKHIPSYFYEVDKMRDPFIPFMEAQDPNIAIQQAQQQGTASKKIDCPRPDLHRVRVGLELVPLDSLRMVGILEDDKTTWALIMASDGTIYRVQRGDFMGQNSGKVINIEESKIELQELIPNKEGCWTETISSIELNS